MPFNLISPLSGWKQLRKPAIASSEASPACLEIWRDNIGLVVLRRGSSETTFDYRLQFADEAVVDVFFERRLIVISPLVADLDQYTLDHFLADQVAPRILAHHGQLTLHAGAIQNGDHAILVMGESGRGKSTLVASFDQAGFPILGDDALLISMDGGVPCAKAVYPSLRLLPDSLKALFSEQPATLPAAHYTSKQRITVPVKPDCTIEPLPIAAIFSLAPPCQDENVILRPMNPAETCMALITNSFALDPTDKALSRKKLEDASRLANLVPAFEISYPRDYARLPDVHAAIFRQVAETGLARQ